MYALDSEALQHECGESSTNQHGGHHYHESRGENELSLGALCVPDGQGERDGSAETSKDQHVLETVLDSLGSAQVEDEGEDVYVYDATGKDGNLITLQCFVKDCTYTH